MAITEMMEVAANSVTVVAGVAAAASAGVTYTWLRQENRYLKRCVTELREHITGLVNELRTNEEVLRQGIDQVGSTIGRLHEHTSGLKIGLLETKSSLEASVDASPGREDHPSRNLR